MILEKETAKILCSLYPEYLEYMRNDGCIAVELRQALYGCIESALLWYSEIKNFLLKLGFRCCSNTDKCLFIHDEKGIKLVLYVDDIFITAKDTADIEWVFNKISDKYGQITQSIGEKKVKYLGLEFDFTTPGACEIKMERYVASILKEFKSDRKQDSPCGLDLFKTDLDKGILSEKDQDCFHSTVAKLLYLAKRVKPGLLTGISYLTTRVKKANIDDVKKLFRIIDFLRGNKDCGIKLPIRENYRENILAIRAFIDAAFGLHFDFKSHTGIVIFLSGAPIYFQSVKQKTISKSSFEAEVNATSDGGSIVIHIANLIKDIDARRTLSVEIMQDNEGAIAALKSGNCTGKNSKHINIRLAWCSEQFKMGIMKFTWTSTFGMVADILTKPMCGELFKNFNLAICGYKSLN
jgi:hypothetical protein